jgi:hypothetical protein
MTGRAWSQADLDLARANYKRHGTEWIAKQLGRTPAAVLQKLNLLRCMRSRPRTWWRGEFQDFIRRGVAAGQLDGTIAEAWNVDRTPKVDRRTVCYIRRASGIQETNAVRQTRLQRQRFAAKRQAESLGIRSVKDLSRRAWRRLAISAGWPLDCSPMEVRILTALQDGHWRTRIEILAAMGDAPDYGHTRLRCRRVLQNFDTSRGRSSALGNLALRGLIVRSNGRCRAGVGKGRSLYVYKLSDRAAEYHRRATRRKCG